MAQVTKLNIEIRFGRFQQVTITAEEPVPPSPAQTDQAHSTREDHEKLVREILIKTLRAYDHQDPSIDLNVNGPKIQIDPHFVPPPLNFADFPPVCPNCNTALVCPSCKTTLSSIASTRSLAQAPPGGPAPEPQLGPDIINVGASVGLTHSNTTLMLNLPASRSVDKVVDGLDTESSADAPTAGAAPQSKEMTPLGSSQDPHSTLTLASNQ